MEKNYSKTSFHELLQVEKDNLIAEINERVKRKKELMNPNDKYDTDNELLH